jgi:O-methyltransferase
VFLKGWFKDTLPTLTTQRFSLLRLDGDMYESTMDALTNLYDKLSPGGFIIIDDYALSGCYKAVTDFRALRDVREQLVDIDGMGSYWRKSA